MATKEKLLELQRLQAEGKDVGGLRQATEGQLFEEADARIDAFWAERRKAMEGIIPMGKNSPDNY